ncbi:hypothetical protein NA57DRAFT_74775 [Rhizodiscina lignyota]|uniref:EthD domain-containing protein n=1 Tax=Rhizodiscina lignyota TaxID=1504668 RepID=A0A9P4IFX0_9PEZI|nr:hypothetical protein NA57DRAFT_74775 [Rhizodiscina lignyota]
MTSKPYVKISLFLKKLPNISDEQFHEHWKGQHVKLAMQNKLFANKTRKYNQHHITPEYRKQAAEFGIPVLEYDGVAEVWLDSLDDWKEIASDEEFKKVIVEDEKLFLQHPIHIQIGYDNLVIPEKQ